MLVFPTEKSKRKTTLTVGVVLVVGGLEDVEGGDEEVVGGGVELELEDEDPPPLQGWVDSKSEAT
jgi:hypothetical protein